MDYYEQVVPPDTPCGCDSGKALGDCCLQDGSIQIQPKAFRTPEQPTGKAEGKCFLRETMDCGGGISHEHILSKAILQELTTGGFRMTGPGFSMPKDVPLDSPALTTKRLCKRHNEALSPLDAEAGRLLRSLHKIEAFFLQGDDALKLYLFNGFDIERWLLKTLLTLFHGKLTNVNPKNHVIRPTVLANFGNRLPEPYGLYIPIKSVAGGRLECVIRPSSAIQLLTSSEQVIGISLTVSALSLKLLMDGEMEVIRSAAESHAYRPTFLNYYEKNEVRTIAFGWENNRNLAVWNSRGKPDAPLPTNTSG